MIGQVEDGGRVSDSGVIDLQRVFAVMQAVIHLDAQIAREAFFAVSAGIIQFHLIFIQLFRFPNTLVKAAFAAMQAIWSVIERQLIVDAVEREPAAGDAIGKTPGDGAKVGMIGFVVGEAVETSATLAICPCRSGTRMLLIMPP